MGVAHHHRRRRRHLHVHYSRCNNKNNNVNSANYSLLLTLAAFTLLFCASASAIRVQTGSVGGVVDQKSLGGPGSSPPTCRSRCGRCLPCKPVHVPIQPGLSMPLEYYPEAWRCKCENKLFMP